MLSTASLRLALVPLFGFGILAIHGLKVTPDSVAYVSMARSLFAGQGFLGWDGSPLGIWPPGFSVLIAPIINVVQDPIVVGWIVAVIGYSLFCLVTFWLLHLAIEHRRIRALAWVMLCLGSPITQAWPALLSDGSFLLLLVTFLYLYERPTIDSGRRDLGLTVIAAAMPVTRLIGVIAPAFLIIDAVLEVVRARRLSKSLFIRVLSVVPFLALTIRNLLVFGEIAPSLPGDPRPVMEGMRRFSEITTRWVVPQFDSTDVLRITGVIVFLTATLILRRHGVGIQVVATSLRKSSRWIALLAMYLALYWWASITRRLDPPNERLLAPVYVLAVITFWRTAADLWPILKNNIRIRGYSIAAILLVVYGVGHSVNSARVAREWVARSDFHSVELEALVVDAVDRIPAGAQILSNAPDRIYWFTGNRARWLLCDELGAAILPTVEPAPGGAVYVEISQIDRPYLCHPAETDVTELLNFAPSGESKGIRVSGFRAGVLKSGEAGRTR